MAAVQQLVQALEAALGPGKVEMRPERMEPYGRDESDTGIFPPEALAFAESAADVVKVFEICSRMRMPVTPVAARTGKSGGSLPVKGGLSLSLERMNRIKEISPEDLVAVVEPGVITGELMKAVEAKGLFYPPDPNSLEMCTIGGNVAENAGGPRALKYGVTREYVLGLEVVIPTGEILRCGKRSIKGVAGYDLTALFVGSEGTLGVVTEVTLKLIPLPRQVCTALMTFESDLAAARAINAVLAAGILPRTLEYLDDMAIRAVDGQGYRFPAGAKAAVIAELDGNGQDLLEQMGELAEICKANGASEALVAQNEADRRNLWAARRVVSTALRALKPLKISEDVAVPRSQISEMISRIREVGHRAGLLIATYGHAGDGNLHVNVLFDSPADRAKVDGAVGEILKEAVALRGTITGEHGVGIAKRDYIGLEQSPQLIDLQRRLKRLFDPLNILNPGKIFPEA